jgi:hypothetical protein
VCVCEREREIGIYIFICTYVHMYIYVCVCVCVCVCIRYEGYYLKDKMHGHGVYMWPDGRKYNGEYKNNLKHGQVH